MFERILLGIIIGFVSGFAFKEVSGDFSNENKKIFQGVSALIIIAFSGSSF